MKKTLRYLLFVLLAMVLTVIVAAVLIVKIALAPAPGEWSTRVKAGPVAFDVGVPTAIRVATASWFAPRLAGHSLDTRFGPIRFDWDEPRQTLELVCAPCSVSVPELGAQPVKVERLRVTLHRDVVVLNGVIEAGAGAAPALRGRWDGRLSQKGLVLHIDMADAPVAQWYAVFAPTLPELQRARIAGTLALRGQLSLPEYTMALQPTFSQFTVEGLGTEAMLGARTSCGTPAKLSADSWLARAVIAAEDQRFFQHPGYDLTELSAALTANQKAGQVERGGSTLTQQLVKLLVTGSERNGERKLRELLYAVEMEQTLGKARILQLYLDNAPWGTDLCGAEAAARRYFRRSAVRLEPAQAVWLAAMLHNPGAELAQWQASGNVDAARMKSVAEGIRPILRGQRESLLRSVASARFAPP